MSQPTAETNDLADLSSDYSLSPFAHRLSPLITETLRSQQQDRERYGTKLVSSFVVWLVLGLVLRRDKNEYGGARLADVRVSLAVVPLTETARFRRGD